MLTPLLLVADRKLRPESRTGSESGSFSALANTIWGSTLAAVVAVFAQSNWDKEALALSVLPVAALLVAYTALIPRTVKGSRFLPRIDAEEDMAPLSLRIAALLAAAFGAQAFAFGVPSVDIVVPTLSLGLAKAFSWYFKIQTVCGLPKLVFRECLPVLGTTHVVVCRHGHMDLRHSRESGSIHSAIRDGSRAADHSLVPPPYSTHPHASKASKRQGSPLGPFPHRTRPLRRQHTRYQSRTSVSFAHPGTSG